MSRQLMRTRKAEFSLDGIVTLTFQASPVGSGRIEISTIIPTTYPWTGDYFNGNPLTLTAIPNPGFKFDHWRSNKTINRDNPNQTVTYNFTKNEAIKAFFTGSAVTPKICVSELNYNSNSSYNAGDWIELHNYGTTSVDISGWRMSDGSDNHNFVFPTGTEIPVNGYLVLVEDSIKFKSQFPSVNNWLGLIGFNFSNKGDQVRLINNLDLTYISFFYQDIAPWPVQANGLGYTCELSVNNANPNNGNSWFAGCIGGSPGKAYGTSLTIPVTVSGSTTICSGGSTILSASYFQGSTYQWKKNNINIGGATDSVYSASQAGSYSANITNNGCSALTSASVVSTVSQQPEPTTTSTSRCGAGDLTLYATSSDSVFWYDNSTNGNLVGAGDVFHIPYITQSTTYYARTGKNCPSNSVATLAEIIPAAASPVSNDTLRCGPGIVTLNATDTAEIRWYNASVGGGLLATGSSFTTNILENDTSYFIEAGSVCPSSRIEVRVMISSTPEPVVSDASRCGNGTLTFTANSSAPVYWYEQQSGGISLGSGFSFTTSFLTEADTFYAEANNGCPSARVRVMALVNSIPPDPIVENVTICGSGSATLIADATEQVNWYDSISGGNLLFTGSNFTTPDLTNTQTYYASTGYECPSNRVPVQVIIKSIPPSPIVSDVSRCGPGSLIVSASSSLPISWYSSPSGGLPIASGNSFTTPYISNSVTYYVAATDECESLRAAVNANIVALPIVDIGPDTIVIPAGQSITLDAGTGFSSYYWSTNQTSPQIRVTVSGVYSVVVTNSIGCTATDEMFVDIITSIKSINGGAIIKLYPNPAKEKIILEISDLPSKTIMIKLYSLDGKMVKREIMNSPNGQFKKTILLSGITSGLYFLEVESDNYSTKLKVVVE